MATKFQQTTGAPLDLPQWNGEVFNFEDVNLVLHSVNKFAEETAKTVDLLNENFTLNNKFPMEIGAAVLENTQVYPFNDSATTISLKTVRDNLDYTIQTEIASSSGSVGTVEVYDKQTNGFKLRFTGSGKTAEIKYYVTGGLVL